MEEMAAQIVRNKLVAGTLEPCFGPYRNSWFLISKKDGGGRLIIDLQPLNKVMIRDAGILPSVDGFSEAFAGCPIMSVIDFFSGYDQKELAEECRDMTVIMTPLGLLRMTKILQGGTNSVTSFQCAMMKVLQRHIPHHAKVFVDDVGIKGPMSRYGDEEIRPGV